MRRLISLLALTALIFGLISCKSTEPYVSDEVSESNERVQAPSEKDLIYSVFLIGDAGRASLDPREPVLKLLESKLNESGENSAVVFLGDNIYPDGLPPQGHAGRKEAESRLLAQLKTVEGYPGRVFFIPGNHDWYNWGSSALQTLERQEDYIENYLDRGNVFLPDNGFPGPIDIELVDGDENERLGRDIRLIVMDTEWWLREGDKPFGDTGTYALEQPRDFMSQLDSVVTSDSDDYLLVAAHHPLFSNGAHGGVFPWKRHLLPPVFGSMYVFYRKIFGLSNQDIPHRDYQKMKKEFIGIFSKVDGLIYASAHQHSLQYFKKKSGSKGQHYLVSGSGSKVDFTARGKGAEFTYQGIGFAEIRYYSDSSSWLRMWAVSDSTGKGRLILETRIDELK